MIIISELAIVETTTKTKGKRLGKEIGYDINIDILRDTAQQYDFFPEKTDPKQQHNSKCNFNKHDIIDPDDGFIMQLKMKPISRMLVQPFMS